MPCVCFLGLQEVEGRKHRMINQSSGREDEVPVHEVRYEELEKWSVRVCNGLKVGEGEPRKRKTKGHGRKDKFMGGHHLQSIVDVGTVRTLIWCRRCASWASVG